MTRKEKIQLIKKILSGEVSLNELLEEESEGRRLVLIKIEKNIFSGSNGQKYTSDEMKKLSGHLVIIHRPDYENENESTYSDVSIPGNLG